MSAFPGADWVNEHEDSIRCVLCWRCGNSVEGGLERLGRFGDGDGCPSLDTCRDDLLDGKRSCCDLSHGFVG